MITKQNNNTLKDNYNLPHQAITHRGQTSLKRIQDYVFNFNDLLGQGNFSKVYRAHKDNSNQTVAIKIIELNSLKSKKLEELLFSEIEILKRLNHQSVLKCHEVFTSNRNCYIITQLCNEGDLQSKLKAKKQMKQDQAEPFIKAIFKGLIYLGQMGIIHRDLKVANIFIHDGKVKIADFGFAKATRVKFKDINIGSPIYMSPEGFIHNYYGPKTDIWAFGMLIYEILHGRTPFSHCKSQNELKYNMSIPIGWSQLKPQLSTQIKQVIMKCLEVDQQKRVSVSQLQQLAYFAPKILKNHFNSKFDQNALPQLLSKRNEDTLILNKLYNKKKGDFLDTQQANSSRELFQQYKNGMRSENTIIPQLKTRIKTQNDFSHNKHQRQFSNYHIIQRRDDNIYTLKQSKDKFLSINYYPQLQKNIKNRNTASSSNFLNSQRNNDKEEVSKHTFKINDNHSNKEDIVLSAKITFKECVNILHYSRLLFKHLVLMKELNFGDQNQHNIFKRWLSTILKTLIREIRQKKIKYQGDNLQARERKLEQVTTQYVKKYTKQLGLDLSKVKLQQSGVINHQKINNYFKSVYQLIDQLVGEDRTNQGWLRLGTSMIMILQGSKILKQCFDEKFYSKITRLKQIEQFLSTRQEMSFILYQNYKRKYFFS